MQLPTCQQLNFLSNTWHLGVILLEGVLLLMVEILHHLGCTKLCESWDRLLVNWCRISSINSSIQVNILDPESVTMATIFTSNRIWLKGINFEEIPPTLLEITFVVMGWFWSSLQYVFFMEDSPRFWMIFRTISFQLPSSGALTS